MPIKVTAKRKEGMYRGGVHHGNQPNVYPDGYFTPEQLEAIKAEPLLVVEEVGEDSEKDRDLPEDKAPEEVLMPVNEPGEEPEEDPEPQEDTEEEIPDEAAETEEPQTSKPARRTTRRKKAEPAE